MGKKPTVPTSTMCVLDPNFRVRTNGGSVSSASSSVETDHPFGEGEEGYFSWGQNAPKGGKTPKIRGCLTSPKWMVKIRGKNPQKKTWDDLGVLYTIFLETPIYGMVGPPPFMRGILTMG